MDKIEIKELRIGNVLYAEKRGEKIVATVYELSEDGKIGVSYNSGLKGRAIIQVSPIELTEDILFKCRLSKNPKDHTMYFFPNVNTTYFLKEENGSYCVCIDDCGKLIHTMRSFQYLHQLQNAFFVTYHKELNIPLPL